MCVGLLLSLSTCRSTSPESLLDGSVVGEPVRTELYVAADRGWRLTVRTHVSGWTKTLFGP
ncbi:hypothetical protein BS78_K138500 [Paspalum vaginatum]|uniref:Uncharacterized protein n=1 Tax=Paspalum vaginatum TaxID=158149 RepID=A0A9W8CFN4_9POAL|nr:hypothetical protein BS78_K138500 [Paspalum vaginatum]